MTSFTPFSTATWGDILEQIAPDGGTVEIDAIPGIYRRALASAQRMLARYKSGKVILYRETSTAPTDPSPRAVQQISQSPIVVNSVVLGNSSEQNNDGKQISKVELLMDPTDIETKPFKGQELSIDGRYHVITQCNPIVAAGLTSLYIVQAQSAN